MTIAEFVANVRGCNVNILPLISDDKLVGISTRDVSSLPSWFSCPELPAGLVWQHTGALRITALREIPENVSIDVTGSLAIPGLRMINNNVHLTARAESLDCSYIDVVDATGIGAGIKDNVTLHAGRGLYMQRVTSIGKNCRIHANTAINLSHLQQLPEDIKFAGSANTVYNSCIDQQWRGGRILAVDHTLMSIDAESQVGDVTVYSCHYFNSNKASCFVAKYRSYFAHGETAAFAIADVKYKYTRLQAVSDIVSEVITNNTVTAAQYRAITGACRYGVERFLEKHNLQNVQELPLDHVLKLTRTEYGGALFLNMSNKRKREMQAT